MAITLPYYPLSNTGCNDSTKINANFAAIVAGSGSIDGSGTANYLPKWSDADTLTNSRVYDAGAGYPVLVGRGTTVGTHLGSMTSLECDDRISIFADGSSNIDMFGAASGGSVTPGTDIGFITSYGNIANDYATEAGYIKFSVDASGTVATSRLPGKISFYTHPDSTASSIERMTINMNGTINISTCANAGVDTDKFLVLDSGNNVDFRTGAELASDIGANGTKELSIFESDVSVCVGDGTLAWVVPALYNGYNITAALAAVHTKGVTDATTVMVRRRRAGSDVDVLSTGITIGDEYFAADGTIDTDNDDLATGDMVFIDVDGIHSTAPLGLFVSLTIAK